MSIRNLFPVMILGLMGVLGLIGVLPENLVAQELLDRAVLLEADFSNQTLESFDVDDSGGTATVTNQRLVVRNGGPVTFSMATSNSFELDVDLSAPEVEDNSELDLNFLDFVIGVPLQFFDVRVFFSQYGDLENSVNVGLSLVNKNGEPQWFREIVVPRTELDGQWTLRLIHGEVSLLRADREMLGLFVDSFPNSMAGSFYLQSQGQDVHVHQLRCRGSGLTDQDKNQLHQFFQAFFWIKAARAMSADFKFEQASESWAQATRGWPVWHEQTPTVAWHQIEAGVNQVMAGDVPAGCHRIAQSWPKLATAVRKQHPWHNAARYQIRQALARLAESIPPADGPNWHDAIGELVAAVQQVESMDRDWMQSECQRIKAIWNQAKNLPSKDQQWIQTVRAGHRQAQQAMVLGNAAEAYAIALQRHRELQRRGDQPIATATCYRELQGDLANLAINSGFVSNDHDLKTIEALFQSEDSGWQAALSPRHPKLVLLAQHRASVAYLRGQWQVAKQIWQEALEAATIQFGPDSPEAIELQATLGRHLQMLGEFDASRELRVDSSWRHGALVTAGVIPRFDQILHVFPFPPQEIEHPTLKMVFGAAAPGVGQFHPLGFHNDSAASAHLAARMNLLVDPFFERSPWPSIDERAQSSLETMTPESSYLRTLHPFVGGIMADLPLANLPSTHLWRIHLNRNESQFEGAQPPPPIPAEEIEDYWLPRYQALNRSLQQSESILGADHPETAICHEAMTIAHYSFGQLNRAAQHAQQAEAIYQSRLGETNPRLMATRNTIGVLLYYRNRLKAALEILQQTCRDRIGALGETHYESLRSMNDTAVVARALGRYDLARRLLDSAIARWPEVDFSGNDFRLKFHRRVVMINRCVLLAESGDLQSAQQGLLELLSPEMEFSERQNLLLSLSSIAIMKSDYRRAESFLQQAKPTEEFQQPDPQVPHSLGIVYRQLGQFDRSVELLQQALEMRRQNIFGRPEEIGDTLTSLGLLQQARGQYEQALESLLAARKSYVENLGAVGLRQADTLRRIGLVLLLLGRNESAVASSQQALDAKLELAREMAASFSETEAILFSKTLTELEPILSSLAADREQNAAIALETVWKRKAIVTQLMQQRQRMIVESDDPGIQSKQSRLLEIRHMLSTLLGPQFQNMLEVPDAAGQVYFDPEQRAQQVARLTSEKEALQRELGRIYPASLTLGATDCQSVGDRLGDGEVLLEFVKVGFWGNHEQGKGAADGIVAGRIAPELRYQAFTVQRQQGSIQVNWYDLGKADEVDRLVEQMRRLVHLQGLVSRGLEVVDVKTKRADPNSFRHFSESLPDSLLKTVFAANHVFVVPDGSLHGVPWAAIQDRQQRYLIESASVSLLDRGSELAAPKRPVSESESMLLVGGVSYGELSNGNRSWLPLSGTGAELGAIDGIIGSQLEVQKLSGDDATELSVIEQLKQTRVAHFATHGFYQSEPAIADASQSDWQDPRLAKVLGRNPLSRCGLVLSAANRLPQMDQRGVPFGPDGLLTAEELCDLDLRSLDLAVLSACETGLGQVTDNEGAFGLHRALTTAGARSTIGSLWQVSDEATKELMSGLYSELVAKKQSVAQALRTAQLQLLSRTNHHRHPFFWAAFVVAGDAESQVID